MRRRVFTKSPVRENRTPGSVRGLSGNWQSYRDLRSEEQEETISSYLRPEPCTAGFPDGKLRTDSSFAGLALICLKNETKAGTERDLRDLISLAGTDVTEKA